MRGHACRYCQHQGSEGRTMVAMSRAAQQRYRLTTPGRRVLRGPKPEVVLGIIESLPRDGHVLLESMDQPEVYIQVWLRPDGSTS